MDDKKYTFLNTYEIKRATADIKDLKQDIKDTNTENKKQDERITELEKRQALIEQKLDAIIKNTERTNTSIQNAIYGAVATAVIGGGIAIIWAYLGGG